MIFLFMLSGESSGDGGSWFLPLLAFFVGAHKSAFILPSNGGNSVKVLF